MPGNCPAWLPPTAARLWKTFRSKPNAIPVGNKNCSPSHRNRVHFQTGMLFGITTEWCSASDRNRVHLRPDSPQDHERTPRGPNPAYGRPKSRQRSEKDETPCCSEFPDCSCSELLK